MLRAPTRSSPRTRRHPDTLKYAGVLEAFKDEAFGGR